MGSPGDAAQPGASASTGVALPVSHAARTFSVANGTAASSPISDMPKHGSANGNTKSPSACTDSSTISRTMCRSPATDGDAGDAPADVVDAASAKPAKRTGLAGASLLAQITFSWVYPILRKVHKSPNSTLEEGDGYTMMPESDDSYAVSERFDNAYQRVVTQQAAKPGAARPVVHGVAWTLLRLYWPTLLLHAFWCAMETALRLASPVLLREFLSFLGDLGTPLQQAQWRGWLLALGLGLLGFLLTLTHHQLFWIGMRMGQQMRQQCIAAVHAKVLRFNSATVAAISAGKVVNIVSNDVRRFDDAAPFWLYIVFGPVELAMVLLMVALELGIWPALAGVSATLAIIPLQAALVTYIGDLRRSTAARTDERVRLAGEVIQGTLAMKMLSWEDQLASRLCGIRRAEASFIRKMSTIKAINLAMQFAVPPLTSFITFAVARALNGGFTVSSVFYALSLLALPRTSMVNFFVLAIQTLTELRVSLQRIDGFLTTPEPPLPVHHDSVPPAATAATDAAAADAADGLDQDLQSPVSPILSPGFSQTSLTASLLQPPTSLKQHSQVPLIAAANGTAASSAVNGIGAANGTANGAAKATGFRPPPPLSLGVGNGGVYTGSPALQPAISSGGAQAGPGATCQGGIATTPACLSLMQGAKEWRGGRVALRGSDYDWLRPLGAQEVVIPLAEKPQIAAETKSGGGQTAGDGKGADLRLQMEPVKGHPPAAGHAPGQDAVNGGGTEVGTDVGASAALRGVELDMLPGELLGVCGEVGSGKSSLLMALLGELQPLQPELGPVLSGSLAYCSQIPWIVAGTVRDNIVFGSPFDEAWYRSVLAACALEEDISGLPAGDFTELGERGINLSGGQKARVALARACYSRASVVLLDDPLSAVDPRVGRVLFDRCIGPAGLMAAATRVLVTHQRQYLPRCDRVMVLRGGSTAALGTFADLAALQMHEMTAGPAAVSGDKDGDDLGEACVDDVVAAADDAAVVDDETRDGAPSPLISPTPFLASPAATAAAATAVCSVSFRAEAGRVAEEGCGTDDAEGRPSPLAVESPAGGTNGTGQVVVVLSPSSRQMSRQASRWSRSPSIARLRLSMTRTFRWSAAPSLAEQKLAGKGIDGLEGGMDDTAVVSTAEGATSGTGAVRDPGQLVAAEDRQLGDVPARVYFDFMRYMGVVVSLVVATALICGQGVYLYSEFWLAFWSRSADQTKASWLNVYAALTAAVVVVGVVRSVLFFRGTLRASVRIHNAMTVAVLHAPLAFFHTNPAGRILNRFSKDLGLVDDLLPTIAFDTLQSGFQCLGAFVLVAVAVPVVLPLFLPLALAFWFIRRQYIVASREIKRWEAVTRSPVYAFFSATLKGLPTIRAYGASQRFHLDFLRTLSLSGSWSFTTLAAARWIGFRLDVVAASTLMCASLLSMVMRNSISPALLGLALSHVLQLTGLMQWFVRQTAEVENGMTSVERMLEYTKLPQEPASVAAGGAPPPVGWPSSGALRYDNVVARYRPGLAPVLSGISFQLSGGQSCGVVGRTGSGKSSLMLTLFRLIDLTGGTIYLDGVDTSSMGLDALRRQLAIIPQDPVLFSGTLRSNLDPWDQQQDARLWSVLEAVRLRPAIEAAGGLHAPMAEAGDNLSVGQRQLFCLARALLQDARVLALDEATANVDRATDALIQRALRDFAHSDEASMCKRVLLVIAHRIDTVLDCDHLLVLSAGALVEQGPPGALAAATGGHFSRMVAAARVAASKDRRGA